MTTSMDFHDDAIDDDSAVGAFLAGLVEDDASKKKPSSDSREGDTTNEEEAAPEQDETEEGSEETPETDADEEGTEETEEDEGQEDDKASRKYADEGLYFKIKVGDEDVEVPVKDLGRLYGQEKALTQRSQEVAARRKELDAEYAKTIATSNALLERAQARLKPYQELDFLALSRDTSITTEELTALRQQAQAAYEEVQFLTQEQDNYMRAVQQQQHKDLVEAAKAAHKDLSDPEKGLPGWSDQLYNDIRTFAVSAGAPAEIVNKLVDPWAIRILHKAMMFDRGTSNSKTKVVTTKVNKTPKKVIKTSTNPSASKAVHSTAKKKAITRLQQTGSTDDSVAAFLATLEDTAD